MINLIRCDDRLIHGQCMTTLVQYYHINHIIVIDETTATNAQLKMLIELLAMPGKKNEVFTLDDAIEPVKAAINDNVGTMIAFRFPEVAKELFDRVEDLPKKLMIGPVVKTDDNDVEAQIGTYLSQAQIDALSYLADEKGVEIFFQTTPEMKRTEFADFKAKI